jgi:nitrogen regulatory protein P-II 2
MRLVAANIQTQPFKLDEGRRVRTALGVQGMTATEVKGFGQQKRHTEICRGTAPALSFVPKVRIDLVASEQADEVVAAIQNATRVRRGRRRQDLSFRQSSEPFAFALERPTKQRCKP